MKNRYSILILFVAMAFIYSCNNSNNTKTVVVEKDSACCNAASKSCCSNVDQNKSEVVQVIYFHNERRCATCMAVEEVSKEVIAKLDSSKISFVSYAIGDPQNVDLEKKFEVSGQKLIVIGKEGTSDLTNTAFLNARIKPEQFKEDLLKAINL